MLISILRTSGWWMMVTAFPPPATLAALHPLLGVRERLLVGSLGDRQALHADREAREVHHDEHVLEAVVLLATR